LAQVWLKLLHSQTSRVMSLAVLRGLATAFNDAPMKDIQSPRPRLLGRRPSKELVLEELQVPQKSTSQIFDSLVSQLSFNDIAEDGQEPGDDDSKVVESPWQRIDDIGEGLYICGAAALEQTDLLREMGIHSVVNCAEASLYTRTDFCSDGQSLAEHLKDFRIETLDAEDVEHCSMTGLWERASQFIDESLQYGGVVIHCAMGVSRSSSTCIAYLMLRHKMSLDAAFRKVHQARDHIMPNCGFWEELRALEKRTSVVSSLASGAEVREDSAGAGQVIAMLDLQVRQKREAAIAGW